MKTFEDQIREVLQFDAANLPEQDAGEAPSARPIRRWAPMLVAAVFAVVALAGLAGVIDVVRTDSDVAARLSLELDRESGPAAMANSAAFLRAPRTAVSPNGRFVVYVADDAGTDGLLIWDRDANTTMAIGPQAGRPGITFGGVSDDGGTVVYAAQAEDTQEWQTTVWRRDAAVQQLDQARDPSLSPDGRYLVVRSTDGPDLIVHDLQQATRATVPVPEGLRPRDPAISADARYVAYIGAADSGDTSVYVTDLDSATTSGLPGQTATGPMLSATSPDISADGQLVAFTARPLQDAYPLPTSARGWSVFVWDRAAATIDMLPAVPEHLEVTPFVEPVNLVRPADSPSVLHPQISDDGTIVTFSATTNSSVADSDRVARPDVGYVWNRPTGDVTLITRTAAGRLSADAAPSLAADSSMLVFVENPFFYNDRADGFQPRPVAVQIPTDGWDLPAVQYSVAPAGIAGWLEDVAQNVGVEPPQLLYSPSAGWILPLLIVLVFGVGALLTFTFMRRRD